MATTDRWRHKARGTTYRILFEAAKASSVIAALDDMTMVVYQGEADGLVWVRPALEFFDGRFERVPYSNINECPSCKRMFKDGETCTMVATDTTTNSRQPKKFSILKLNTRSMT